MQVSKWLGHANFSITLNVCGDYIPEDECGKLLRSPSRPPRRSPRRRTPAP